MIGPRLIPRTSSGYWVLIGKYRYQVLVRKDESLVMIRTDRYGVSVRTSDDRTDTLDFVGTLNLGREE